MAKMRHFSGLARALLLLSRPLGSTPRRGGCSGSLVPCTAPSSFSGFGAEEFLQLTALEHLHHDVRSADELALHIELGDRRPFRIFLDALADFRILENVDGLIVCAQMIEDRDRSARKATLRENRGPFHEEHDVVALHELVDAGIGVTHWSSPLALRFRAAMREAHPLLAPQAPNRQPGAAECGSCL